MNWFFPPLLPSQVETEVTQRDQFSNDDIELSETIVREVIQNSLDAAIDDSSTVSVSFRFLEKSEKLTETFMKPLFKEQEEHAKVAGLEDVDFTNPRALVIEDFGTKGLTGSLDTKDENNFSDFWRRHGKSHKTGKSRGRWGLGKLVYSTTSQIGVFWGATVRAEDPNIHLMGQTVLNLRKYKGKEYPPHAFFSDINSPGDPYKEIPVPIKNRKLVNEFVERFSLERSKKPGLSIIIPFPNPSFKLERMISVAISNYFYPIVTNQLTLKFNETEINSANVRNYAHKYASADITDIDILFDFIKAVNSYKDELKLILNKEYINERLTKNDLNEKVFKATKTKFDNNELISFKIPLILKKKNNRKVQTFFEVYIQKPSNLEVGRDLYVRDGLTLPGESKLKHKLVLSAVVAEDEEICSFLGDAENAAHTKWIQSAEKVKRNYKDPQKTIRFIKNSIVELVELLSEEENFEDTNVLTDFFWTNDETIPSERPTPTPPKPEDPPTPPKPEDPPPPPPRLREWEINKANGGFSIISTNDLNSNKLPITKTIKLAYDLVGTKKPFEKYKTYDFSLGVNGTIEVITNAEIEERRENYVKLKITKLPFEFTALGFDEHRDLKIKFK